MKKVLFLFLLLSVFFISLSAHAESSILFEFPEFSVLMSDDYLILTKDNTEKIIDTINLFDDPNSVAEYFELDPTLRLNAINYPSSDEICIRCIENPTGVDWSVLRYYDSSYQKIILDALKNNLEKTGFDCHSAIIYQHPQTLFAVIEGYQTGTQGYTVFYYTVARINDKFYNIAITGICSTKNKNDKLVNDLQYLVSTLKISGYPDFDILQSNNIRKQYRSKFQLFDGECFGESFIAVVRNESKVCEEISSIGKKPEWYEKVLPYIPDYTYSWELSYYDIICLGIEHSSKTFMFDENNLLYSTFYEFRSGYNTELEGQDNLNNFEPAYNTIELYLRDLYGNPQYQYKKGTKAETDGYGMKEANWLLNGNKNVKLYDYSEWIIDDPIGKIKVEHIMYYTGYIYKHNVSIEFIQ